MKALSLFANVGIGETYLHELGIETVVANELLQERVDIYRHFYPHTDMVCGDINKAEILNAIIEKAQKQKVKLIIATPPCQGMSLAGKQSESDPRNTLIVKVMEVFNQVKPDYMLIENVPQMLKTSILYKGSKIKISDFIESQVSNDYSIHMGIFDCADYGTPQSRKRTFIKIHKKELKWLPPIKQKTITVKDSIGDLPSLNAGEDSGILWHKAKIHNANHILWLTHTPTGKTALDNKIHYPQKNGRKIKGFSTTYKRITWDKPAPTITMANGSISSQNNVHPGRLLSDGTYSDARVLTILEILRLMGLPDNWSPPEISDNLIRHVIGEAVPPIMMKNMLKGIF